MKLQFGYSTKYFSELIKVEDFSTIEEFLKMINEAFDDGHWEELTKNEIGSFDCELSQIKYAQISGDGTIYFVSSLDEFSEDYRTEEGWNVEFWTDKITY